MQANISEIGQPDLHRLPGAHRQAGDGPLRPVGKRAVGGVDLADQVVDDQFAEGLVAAGTGRRGSRLSAAAARGATMPFSITTIIGRAFLAAIRLSRMKFARPCAVQPRSFSPAPCCK